MKKIILFVLIICILIAGWVIDRRRLLNRPVQDDRARAKYVVFVVTRLCADSFVEKYAWPRRDGTA